MGRGLMRFWWIWILTWHLCVAGYAEANRNRPTNFFALDLGAYGANLSERFTAPEAYRGHVSQLGAFLRLRRGFLVDTKIFFEPGFGLVAPWRSGADGNTKVFTFHADLPFLFSFFSFFGVRFGPSVQWLWQLSSAQAVELNNGTTTATFYTPGGSSHAFLLAVQAGLVFRFSRRVWLNWDVYALEVGNQERRRFNVALTLGWTL